MNDKLTPQKVITDNFVKFIEESNTLPWQRPWAISRYMNIVSKRPYSGINIILLSLLGKDNCYITPNQVKASGGTIKKGAKTVPVVFYKKMEREVKLPNGGIEDRQFFMMRYYRLLNYCDTEGLTLKRPDIKQCEFQPLEIAEKLAQVAGITIEHGGNSAHYSPKNHAITMPLPETFVSVEAYYKTLFHELTHAIAKELGEDISNGFGSDPYAKEELVAELGANFFLSYCGIDSSMLFENSAAYLQNWLGKLKGDAKLIISAAGKAQKRFDWVLAKLNPQAEVEAEVEVEVTA